MREFSANFSEGRERVIDFRIFGIFHGAVKVVYEPAVNHLFETNDFLPSYWGLKENDLRDCA